MSRLSLSRQARLGIMAGVLATAGAAAAFSLGTANAATGPTPDPTNTASAPAGLDPVQVNFGNTKINSAKVYMKKEDGNWTATCVKKDPLAGNQDTGLRADLVLIHSYTTGDCAGEKLHADTVTQTVRTSPSSPWVIPWRRWTTMTRSGGLRDLVR